MQYYGDQMNTTIILLNKTLKHIITNLQDLYSSQAYFFQYAPK